jgi:hypothetical protein
METFFFNYSVIFCKSCNYYLFETFHFMMYLSDCNSFLYFWESWHHICCNLGMSKHIFLVIFQAFTAVWLRPLIFCCFTQLISVVGCRRRNVWPFKMRPIGSPKTSVQLKLPCRRPNGIHTHTHFSWEIWSCFYNTSTNTTNGSGCICFSLIFSLK